VLKLGDHNPCSPVPIAREHTNKTRNELIADRKKVLSAHREAEAAAAA